MTDSYNTTNTTPRPGADPASDREATEPSHGFDPANGTAAWLRLRAEPGRFRPLFHHVEIKREAECAKEMELFRKVNKRTSAAEPSSRDLHRGLAHPLVEFGSKADFAAAALWARAERNRVLKEMVTRGADACAARIMRIMRGVATRVASV